MKPELSYLAHNLVEIDKYRVETCCVIGRCLTKLTEIHLKSRKTTVHLMSPGNTFDVVLS